MARTQNKQKKTSMNGGLAMIGLTLLIAVVASTVYIDSREMRDQQRAYIEREQALERQISDEEQRTEILNERKKYVTTKQYIEEVARDKLGLLNPDEVLLKEKDD
ncbi:MAG: septum formation initiator [Lachnospiraceae bacterium]|jgi:cell division protein DivIC|nr:septum formation initiator [Lachnospiraceae bacterium]MBQ9402781.1 septum formation initiator [Clostridia bacterium]